MNSGRSNNDDMLRYFSYDLNADASENNTGETVEPYNGMNLSGDSSTLYAHIFHLEQGDYAIGASNGGTANIYYLSVQGQTEGTIGAQAKATIGSAITDVDFLTSSPLELVDGKLRVKSSFSYAHLNFKADYKNVSGEFFVGVDDKNSRFKIAFGNGFTTYLSTYLYSTSVQETFTYYINETPYTESINYTRFLNNGGGS